MDDFDLEAARLIRLRQDIDALLPDRDAQTRQDIFRLLSMGTRKGLDLFPRFRAAIAHREIPSIGHDETPPLDGPGLEVNILPERQRATLWPYRPHRLPDELLSSWLWRVARGLGAPPRRFVVDAIGSRLADVDRDIDDTAIDRLAFLSGQTREHLLRGTMRPDADTDPRDRRQQVQQALIKHGDLVLNRLRGGRGRAIPITQYCPVCLGGEPTRYLRRGWRFSLEVVCSDDGCFLLDACWRCGAVLDPLALAVPCTEFLCCKCKASLARAPSIRFSETLTDQAKLYDDIHRRLSDAAAGFAEFRLYETIRRLSAGDLRGTNPTNAADRHTAVMLEAWELRRGPINPAHLQSQAAAAARRTARKIKIAAGKLSKAAEPAVRTKPSRQPTGSAPSG